MNLKCIVLTTCCLGMLACACGRKAPAETQLTEAKYMQISPDFNADSAYNFIQKQVDFGPRVPNSEAHRICGDYLVGELKKFGADVIEQKFDVKAYDGTVLHARNIIGAYNSSNPERILLFAHWDSRPYSERDPDKSKHHTPVDGANDGASGVGVLLEIARNIQMKSPDMGIDIIFFDVEDYGDPDFAENVPQDKIWWCLGSEHWAKNPHVPQYKARFGILLDMVGAVDARFYKESESLKFAMSIVNKVWTTARNLGYGKYFIDKEGMSTMDDHIPVNMARGVPSIDIIQYDPTSQYGFGWYWHTTKDNMDNISKETLKAVGQTVMEVVYNEK